MAKIEDAINSLNEKLKKMSYEEKIAFMEQHGFELDLDSLSKKEPTVFGDNQIVYEKRLVTQETIEKTNNLFKLKLPHEEIDPYSNPHRKGNIKIVYFISKRKSPVFEQQERLKVVGEIEDYNRVKDIKKYKSFITFRIVYSDGRETICELPEDSSACKSLMRLIRIKY